MKSFLCALALIITSLMCIPAKADIKVKSGGMDAYWSGWLLDYGGELAFGKPESYKSKESSLMLRLRGGYTFIREPIFLTVAPIVDFFNNRPTEFGLQGEVIHLQLGSWMQCTPLIDVKGRTALSFSAGWSLFGGEVQFRDLAAKEPEYLYMLKLKVPISLFVFAFSR